MVVHIIADNKPQIRLLQEGAEIEFAGEYIWSQGGGSIKNTRNSGWIKYNNIVYQ
jgi:Protein of unknown function (DUF3465)